jgi:hypothetical protein
MLNRSGDDGYSIVYFDQNGESYSVKIIEVELVRN